MIKQCEELLAKYKSPQRHSDYQIVSFIIGKEPTFVGRMWQCLREIDSRYENLINIEFELENLQDDLELKSLERQKKVEENQTIEKTIEIRKIDRFIKNLKRNIDKILVKKISIEQECNTFIQIFNELLSSHKYYDFNDANAQREYFENKFSNEINLNILLGNPINNELVKSTMCLDDNSKIKAKLLESLSNMQRKLLTNGDQNK